ncbi:MAG: choice-of-anchor tandem repeat GloVer-containing protein [Terriglobales bacterium]
MFGNRQFPMLSALTLVGITALLAVAARPALGQTETTLYNFTGVSGSLPYGGLTFNGGNFYGTTMGGGSYGGGTVFELSPNGDGGWNEAVLYSFSGGSDGDTPKAPVISDSLGNLYGTASKGSSNGCLYGFGCGLVFELSPVAGGWTETVLHTFNDNGDGAIPAGGLVMDSTGNLYGAIAEGGYLGAGAVFELTPTGAGWTEQVIYSSIDGGPIQSVTMSASGNIFGIGDQQVFEISPDGSGGWNQIRNKFIDNNPTGSLVLDAAGNVYGITNNGGRRDCGTVFQLSEKKKGWRKTILHSFKGYPKDGRFPTAIVLDATGNIYGTTNDGGVGDAGTLFKLAAQPGTAKYEESILWMFGNGGGYEPNGNLVLDNVDNVYGTTYLGGAELDGAVYEVTP